MNALLAAIHCQSSDKRTQKADIKRAKEYWKDHEERKRAGGRTR